VSAWGSQSLLGSSAQAYPLRIVTVCGQVSVSSTGLGASGGQSQDWFGHHYVSSLAQLRGWARVEFLKRMVDPGKP
jgi:hypothetical protein